MGKGGVCGGVLIDLVVGFLYFRFKLFREFMVRVCVGCWLK